MYHVSAKEDGHERLVGQFENLIDAYRHAVRYYPDMTSPNSNWHVMLFNYVNTLLEGMGDMVEPIEVAYEEGRNKIINIVCT
jgi:hypothetical protein